jgi:hypothetical protein
MPPETQFGKSKCHYKAISVIVNATWSKVGAISVIVNATMRNQTPDWWHLLLQLTIRFVEGEVAVPAI